MASVGFRADEALVVEERHVASAPRLRLGILAPEFTTQHGGMQEMARELVERLRVMARCELVVSTDRQHPPTALPLHVLLRNDLRRARRMLRRRPEPDVWLALNAGVAALAPSLAAPMVVYVHGNDLLNPWYGIAPPYDRLLRRIRGLERLFLAERRCRAFHRTVLAGLRAARAIVANSTNTASLVRQRLGDDGALHVVEPGVADVFFRADLARRPGRRAGEPLRLLTVTRLSSNARRKNVDGVLRALRLLPEDVVARFVVVGDGDDRPRLERLAAELGLGARVVFTGAISREALVDHYAATDLFVLAAQASERDVEGFGIVYLEASASGVPVLASRAGGATDAVVEGENGLVLPDATPAAIAAGIRAVADGVVCFDPLRVRVVAERFRWSHVAERLYGVLESSVVST